MNYLLAHISLPDGRFTWVNRFAESDCVILVWGPAETQLAGKKIVYLICGSGAKICIKGGGICHDDKLINYYVSAKVLSL